MTLLYQENNQLNQSSEKINTKQKNEQRLVFQCIVFMTMIFSANFLLGHCMR